MRPESPSNAELAEALFALSDHEAHGERRLAMLKAGYTAFDQSDLVHRAIMREAPSWLKPLISQLLDCPSVGALEAAVQRLASGTNTRKAGVRDGFLAYSEMEELIASGPSDLSPQRMRGAFHWHTTASDGKASIESMAGACARRGSAWALVADHSRGLEIVSGLDTEGVHLQRKRVDQWNDQRGEDLRLFQGLEVEILEGGDLDVDRDDRGDIQCVIAAVHRGLDRRRDQTRRLVRAVSSPGVHVLAHPRGRHFHQRQGIKARWERVFDACAEAGVAVEINGFPRRQDLDWELSRLAVERGCLLVLASDAHAPRHLEFDAYACAIAMRAEVPATSILNTRSAESFADWLEERD